MTWEEALEQVIAETKHLRFGVLCSDAWPDFEGYRKLVLRLAGEEPIESNADRAARLIAQYDTDTPPFGIGRPCGGCPDRTGG